MPPARSACRTPISYQTFGIVDRQVGNDELGEQQILEHVEVDRAAAAVGVGAVRGETSRRDRRRQELVVDGVEVDRGPVCGCLLAERHDDEGAAGG